MTANLLSLKKLGWKGDGGNIPAAYLIGLVCGKEAKKKWVREAVADFGLHPSTKWSRLAAALKGAVDSGLQVPHSPDILPPVDRLTGKHIAVYAEKLRNESPEKYKKDFSSYLNSSLPPEDLMKHMEEIKKKIV